MSQVLEQLAPAISEVSPVELLGCELVARAHLEGKRIVVTFRSPYELFVAMDGIAVMPRPRPEQRRALAFASRRLPSLYTALGETEALVLIEEQDHRFTAVDLFDRAAGRYLSHEHLLTRTERLELQRPTFVALGAPSHEGELRHLVESLPIVGPRVELRSQDEGYLLARAVVDVSVRVTR
ncbi:MAG: hypothetical protein ABIJ09_03525 [Pseudomonadota bacterium]